MIKLSSFVALASLALAGCKDNAAKLGAGSGSALSGKDADVRNALVLDAALTKAKTALDDLEAAQPRDEDAISEKKMAIQAVEETLAKLRARLDGSGRPAH